MSSAVVASIVLMLVSLTRSESRHTVLLNSGYEHFPDVGYYKFYNTLMTWEDAQITCLEEGGQLAVINSEKELNVLVPFMTQHTEYNDKLVLYGFHDRFNEGIYVTTAGTSLNRTGYMKWRNGDPTGTPVENCGAVEFSNGLLADIDCSFERPFVCEQPIWSDYDFYTEIGYYKLHTDGRTWVDANLVCEMEGAHLAVVNSQKEADALADILKHHPTMPNTDDNNVAMIGFSMVFDLRVSNNTAKNYYTVFGQSVRRTGYARWDKDQPNPGIDFHCGAVKRGTALLSMSNCSSHNAFICEHELQDS